MANSFTLSEAARIIDIPKIGRNKIYAILRILNIVDCQNRPDSKFVKKGILDLGSPRCYFNRYVTVVIGRRGLSFLTMIIEDYLRTHPIPTFPKKK